MRDCEVCFSPTRNRKPTDSHLVPFGSPEPFGSGPPGILCNNCRAYVAYWNGLSPADRDAELASMAAYASESQEP